MQRPSTFLSASSIIDKNNDVRTVYKEFENSKKILECNIQKNINQLNDSQLEEYFNKVTKIYDNNTYLPIYDTILNNSVFVNFKKKDILKCLNLFKKQIIDENNFLNSESVEISLNSLHLKNDRFTYYLRKMFDQFEKDYVKCTDLNPIDKKIIVEISNEQLGENNDKRYNFNFIESTTFKY